MTAQEYRQGRADAQRFGAAVACALAAVRAEQGRDPVWLDTEVGIVHLPWLRRPLATAYQEGP